jgi:hypothetical protein
MRLLKNIEDKENNLIMPIPQFKAGMDEQEFIADCISKISDEYDTAQAAAICYQQINLEKFGSKNFRRSLLESASPSLVGNTYSGGMGMKKRKNLSNKK